MLKIAKILLLTVCVVPLVNAQVVNIDMPGVPVESVDPTPRKKAPAQDLKTASLEAKEIKPLTLSLNTGESKMIYISKGMLNQILTPFERPVAKTVNNIELFTEGSSVYVATGSGEAISIVFSEKDMPDASFTLTMVPARIPPRLIKVSVNDINRAHASSPSTSKQSLSQPYIKNIVEIYKEVASGKIPRGYVITNPREEFICASSLRTKTAQILEGSHHTVYILAAVNDSNAPHVFDESTCFRDDVMAISAWPNIHLSPGEQTEIFIMLRNVDNSQDYRMRPSTIGFTGE